MVNYSKNLPWFYLLVLKNIFSETTLEDTNFQNGLLELLPHPESLSAVLITNKKSASLASAQGVK